MSLSSSSKNQRHDRQTIGAPPWTTAATYRLVARVRLLWHQRARDLDVLPIEPMSAFVGYHTRDLVDHLALRHLQGCLICGKTIAPDVDFHICMIDPLAIAYDANSLASLMALTNIGLAHVECHERLDGRPIR